jgi:type III pantothenate kinase
MILDIDVGNSRVKWRAGNQRGICARNYAVDLAVDFPESLAPSRIRVSSVAGPVFDTTLTAVLREQFEVSAEFARTTAAAGGVRCGYVEPGSMGVDRWLAVLAAVNRSRPPLVVIDCGTALTVDFVDGASQHTGGYIVPGLQLMRSALFRETADVRGPPELNLADLEPGRNTQCAVDHGIVLLSKAFIESAVARFARSCEDAPRVYLCGGDAVRLAPQLTLTVELELDLVLDGLAVALP